MAPSDQRPHDIAKRIAERRDVGVRPVASPRASFGRINDNWRRETFRLPRSDAREKARDLFARFPKAAYMTEIERWRECENGEIEFTIRRRHSSD